MCPCCWRMALATSGDKRWTSSPITLRCLENNEYIPACPMPQEQLWVPQKLGFLFSPVLNAFTASESCVFWSISFYLIVKLATFQVLGVCPTIVVRHSEWMDSRVFGHFKKWRNFPGSIIHSNCPLSVWVPRQTSRINCVHSRSWVLHPHSLCNLLQYHPKFPFFMALKLHASLFLP